MKKKFEYEISIGNVFADLKVPNPEEALAKAELTRQISHIIKKKRLTQERAALMLDIDQPKISALINGKFSGFSLERLLRFLNELGQDITIQLKPKARSRKKGYINVTTVKLSEVSSIKSR
jgi:predicted XRE-type DNA-binding protein